MPPGPNRVLKSQFHENQIFRDVIMAMSTSVFQVKYFESDHEIKIYHRSNIILKLLS